MPDITIASLNNGEITPLLDSRSETEKYGSSCRTLENMLPLVYGGVTRRSGTQFIAEAKTATPVRLVEFIYSPTIAYMCEFGAGYIRFYYDGAQLTGGAGAVEVSSPYGAGDLAALQFAQIGDVMWITHGDHAPRKLTRTSATTFALTAVVFDSGPFLTRNDLDAADGVTMTASVTAVGDMGTLTASAARFTAGHVNSLWRITHIRASSQVTLTSTTALSDALYIKGGYSFVGTAASINTLKLWRSVRGADYEVVKTFTIAAGGGSVSYTGTENEDGVQYKIGQIGGAGYSVNLTLSADSSAQDGIVRVNSVTSTTVANVTVLSVLASPDATAKWAEGAWSQERGFPVSVCFFEDRCVYAGSAHKPQTVWLSHTGDYEYFGEDVLDSSSFSLTLTTADRIRWVEALEAIVVGTAGNEWSITSSKLSEPLTPTSFSARQQQTYGSAAIQPVKWGKSILFIDYAGRKLREMAYSMSEDQYHAPDLTVLAEHVTLGGLGDLAVQKAPYIVIWAVRGDGVLLSMTYEREQNVIAWARHPMGAALVRNVGVLPSPSEDEVWLAVTRTVDGTDRQYIERMAPLAFTDASDAVFVDSSLSYDDAPATVFSGLEHLEGEEVAILADGGVPARQTVVNGSVTLSVAASVVTIGLPYRYTVKPVRLDFKVGHGDSRGSIARISELVLSFYRTGGTQYGKSLTALYDIPWRTTEAPGEPPALWTGDKPVALDGGYDPEQSFVVTGDGPLPCTLRAIVVRLQVPGR